MDISVALAWAKDNKEVLGLGLTAFGMFGGGIAWLIARRDKHKGNKPSVTASQSGQQGGQGIQAQTIHGGVHSHAGPNVDINKIVADYAAAAREIGSLQEHNRQLKDRLSEGQGMEALTRAVAALVEKARTASEPDPFASALRELQVGKPQAAENLFQKILDQRKAVGQAANREAARAARHIGAIALYHDTQKALRAYGEATELDPDDPDGWNQLGLLKFRIGDFVGAKKALERVLALGNSTADLAVIAMATGNLGSVYWTEGDLGRAEEMYRKALALDEKLGRKEGMASSYGNLGLVYRTRGNLGKAEEMHRKALALNEELDRKVGVAIAYGNLGVVYELWSDLGKAEEMHRKALAINEKLGNKEGTAIVYGNLGSVYLTRGELEQAEETYRKALVLNEELGRKEGIANNYGNLGNVYWTRGDYGRAEEMHRKALALDEELGRKEGMAHDYAHLGRLLVVKGQKDEGCQMLVDSQQLYHELGATNNAGKIEKVMRELGCPNH